MSDTVDTRGVNWICHTSIHDASHVIKTANAATCNAALAELALDRKKSQKTLRGLLEARLRRLQKEGTKK